MQFCQFFNTETLNSIYSRSFPIRDFPTLPRNRILSSNQALLLLIVIFFLQFFLPLCLSIMFFTFTPYATPKHSTLICIRYFITFFGFQFNSNSLLLLLLLLLFYYYYYYYYYYYCYYYISFITAIIVDSWLCFLCQAFISA